MTPQQEAADQLLREFPKAATKTLAAAAYKRHPELWASPEAARTHFRRMRGAHGDSDRAHYGVKDHYRKPGKPGDPFEKLPKPREALSKWRPVIIPGPANMLVLSDVHIPYHDEAAVLAALNDGKSRGSDLILLNGDISDFFSISTWEKDPRERNFPQEIKDVKEFLSMLREAFPKARIIYKLGNHEERWLRYMRLKAPELLGLPEFEIEAVLGLSDLGIELIADRCPIKVGNLFFVHGHEYRFAISNPVSPARGLALRAKVHAVCGHFHQTSQHSSKTLAQSVKSTWSTGCLCDLHPEYSPLNEWNHGFMTVEIDKDGRFAVANERIIDGKVWH